MIKTNNSNKEYVPYLGPHLQIEFHACSQTSLSNPYLNAIYKPSVCYAERWYLEGRKLIFDEKINHPILRTLCEDLTLKGRLIKSTISDCAYMSGIIANADLPEYHLSAGINYKKLNRWIGFFTSLPDSVEILFDLNVQHLG
jgi:hypothetical protein